MNNDQLPFVTMPYIPTSRIVWKPLSALEEFNIEEKEKWFKVFKGMMLEKAENRQASFKESAYERFMYDAS